MNTLGSVVAIGVLLSIWGTAIYSRKTYEQLVKLNKKIDDFIDNQNR